MASNPSRHLVAVVRRIRVGAKATRIQPLGIFLGARLLKTRRVPHLWQDHRSSEESLSLHVKGAWIKVATTIELSRVTDASLPREAVGDAAAYLIA